MDLWIKGYVQYYILYTVFYYKLYAKNMSNFMKKKLS